MPPTALWSTEALKETEIIINQTKIAPQKLQNKRICPQANQAARASITFEEWMIECMKSFSSATGDLTHKTLLYLIQPWTNPTWFQPSNQVLIQPHLPNTHIQRFIPLCLKLSYSLILFLFLCNQLINRLYVSLNYCISTGNGLQAGAGSILVPTQGFH